MTKAAIGRKWFLPVVQGRRYSDPSKQPGLVSYSTGFDLTENPIREGGIWFSPAPTVYTNTASYTASGVAHGDQNASGQNDTVVTLSGSSWLATQTIISTVYRTGSPGAAEIEHHARTTDLTTGVQLYECDYGVGGLTMAKWQGDGNVHVFGNWIGGFNGNYLGGLGELTDGDLVKFVCSGTGSTVDLYCYQKRVGDGDYTLIGHVQDTAAESGTAVYVSGAPGMGFDTGSGTASLYGFKDYSVVTS